MTTLLSGLRRAILPILVGLLIAAGLLYRHLNPVAPPPVLACDFEDRPASSVLKIPGETSPVRGLHIEGPMPATTQGGMMSLGGSATWADHPTHLPVWGDVFFTTGGSVDGLFLMVGHSPDAADSLRVVTLNGDGLLDENRATAFLFVDPQQKLAHPVGYSCKRHGG